MSIVEALPDQDVRLVSRASQKWQRIYRKHRLAWSVYWLISAISPNKAGGAPTNLWHDDPLVCQTLRPKPRRRGVVCGMLLGPQATQRMLAVEARHAAVRVVPRYINTVYMARLQQTSFLSNPQPRICVRFRGARAHGFNRAICEPTFVPKVGQRRQGCLLKAPSRCRPLVRTRHSSTGCGPSTSIVLANSSSKRSAPPPCRHHRLAHVSIVMGVHLWIRGLKCCNGRERHVSNTAQVHRKSIHTINTDEQRLAILVGPCRVTER